MDKNKRNMIILAILGIIIIFSIIVSGFVPDKAKWMETVPLTGLSYLVSGILLRIIWPLFGSILLVALFPLIFVPAFLKLKKLIWSKYTDSYLELNNDSLSFKKILKRTIYTFLLTYGITALIANYINMELFLASDDFFYWITQQRIEPQYTTPALVSLLGIIVPFSVGLWSRGWTLEDTALMHYKLPQDGTRKLYEIEPIYLKYNNIIKGYAGISSIIYIFWAMIYFIEHPAQTGPVQIFIPIVWGFGTVILSFFAYIFYAKVIVPMMTKKLQKGKEPIPIISINQLKNL